MDLALLLDIHPSSDILGIIIVTFAGVGGAPLGFLAVVAPALVEVFVVLAHFEEGELASAHSPAPPARQVLGVSRDEKLKELCISG